MFFLRPVVRYSQLLCAFSCRFCSILSHAHPPTGYRRRGVQQNAILCVLLGHLSGFWAEMGVSRGEVYNSTAPEADLLDTYPVD